MNEGQSVLCCPVWKAEGKGETKTFEEIWNNKVSKINVAYFSHKIIPKWVYNTISMYTIHTKFENPKEIHVESLWPAKKEKSGKFETQSP